MDISVIVPVYNSSKYLRRCFDSIISQINFDTDIIVELIAVNDCSPDLHDEKIIKEYETTYPNLFRGIKTHENLRQGGARNLGIKEARGVYIYCVDADDFLDAGAIKTMYSTAVSNDADIVVCGYRLHKNNTITKNKPILFDYENPHKFFPGVWCMMVKRQLIIDNGLFFPEKTFYEDAISLFWHLASRNTVVADVYYNWYVHDESTILSNTAMFTSAPKAYKYMVHLSFYKTLNDHQRKTIASFATFQLYRGMHNNVVTGNLNVLNNYCVGIHELIEALNIDLTNINVNNSALFRELSAVFKYIQNNIGDANFASDFIDFYKKTKNEIFLSEISKYTNICLWGSGVYGKKFAFMLKKFGIPYIVVDKNKDRIGNQFDAGIVIHDWNTLKEEIETVIVTALFAFNDVNRYLRKNNFRGQVLDCIDFGSL